MLFCSISNLCVEKPFFNQLILQVQANANQKAVVLLEVHNSKEMKVLRSISESINNSFRKKLYVEPYLICHIGHFKRKLQENMFVISQHKVKKTKINKIHKGDLIKFIQDSFPNLDIKSAIEKPSQVKVRWEKQESQTAKLSDIQPAIIIGNNQLLQVGKNRGVRFLISFVILICASMILFFFVKSSVDIATFSLVKLHQDQEIRARVVCDRLYKKVLTPRQHNII